MKTASLMMVWRFPSGVSQSYDFVDDGEMTSLAREIASHLEIVDGRAAYWRGVAADFEREYLRVKQELREVEEQLEFWAGKKIAGALAV